MEMETKAGKRYYSTIDGISYYFKDGTRLIFKDKFVDVINPVHIEELDETISKGNSQIYGEEQKKKFDAMTGQPAQNIAAMLGISGDSSGGFTEKQLEMQEATLKTAIKSERPGNVQMATPQAPVKAIIPVVTPGVKR